jgi:hypothetical protein
MCSGGSGSAGSGAYNRSELLRLLRLSDDDSASPTFSTATSSHPFMRAFAAAKAKAAHSSSSSPSAQSSSGSQPSTASPTALSTADSSLLWQLLQAIATYPAPPEMRSTGTDPDIEQPTVCVCHCLRSLVMKLQAGEAGGIGFEHHAQQTHMFGHVYVV